MAKQLGPIKFRGALDDVCGRKTEDGDILQRKPGPTRKQVLNNKRFINTRRNAREFGGAVAASTLLRRVLGHTVKAVKHSKLVSYMNKQLHEVVMSDTESDWGDRCVHKGDLQLLEGFDYNQDLGLAAALPVKLSYSLDAATGQVQLSVPGCLVRHKNVFPKEATHFRIVSCAGAVNFNKKRSSFHIAESELLPLSKKMAALQLEHQLAGKPGEVMLHTAGMVFYEVVDGKARMLRGGVLKIVEVTRVEAKMRVPQQKTLQIRTLALLAQPSDCVSASDEKDIPVIDKNSTWESVPLAERQVCSNVCVEEDTPMVQVVVPKKKVCSACVLSEVVRGIALEVKEEKVVHEVLVDDVDRVVEEATVDVVAEIDYFTVGIMDAKGTPLLGAVGIATSDRVPGKAGLGKKSRLKRYCKE